MVRFFDYVSEDTTAEKSILLGNGFSISIHPRFKFDSLVDILLHPEQNGGDEIALQVAKILRAAKTVDVEECIRFLLVTKRIVPLYVNESQEIVDALGVDIADMQLALQNAIAEVHPTHKGALSPSSYDTCSTKLSSFMNVFTLNYDLLLDWVMLSPDGSHKYREGLDDGFRFYKKAKQRHFKRWSPIHLPYLKHGLPGESIFNDRIGNGYQNVFHLHGALNYHIQEGELSKYLGAKDANDMFLTQMCKGIMTDNRFPLVVIEGTPEAKLEAINRDPYLRASYDALLSRKGTLYIYGSKIHEKDDHIRTAIIKSRIDRVVFGFQAGRYNEKQNNQIRMAVNGWITEREDERKFAPELPELEIVFVDTYEESFWETASESAVS